MQPKRRNRNITHSRNRHSKQLVRALLMGGLSVAGCDRAPARLEGAARSVVADIIVSVSNQTSRRMTIYLRAGSTEDSLGVVAERSSRSFPLPSGLGGATNALTFEARELRAAAGIRSEAFAVLPGQQVLWVFDERGSRQVMTR